MYVKSVKSLKAAYASYLSKQKIVMEEDGLVAHLADETYVRRDGCWLNPEDEPTTMDIQKKLDSIIHNTPNFVRRYEYMK